MLECVRQSRPDSKKVFLVSSTDMTRIVVQFWGRWPVEGFRKRLDFNHQWDKMRFAIFTTACRYIGQQWFENVASTYIVTTCVLGR